MTFPPTILRFDSIDSTNLEAMRQAKAGAPEGLCVVAREQTAGRGRLERSWHSPKDAGLYLSIVLRPETEMETWPLITLSAALAVADALKNECGLRVDIKWPNDLCVNERKLCGILAETIETAKGHAVVLGIGINLLSAGLDETLRDLATSIETETNTQPDASHLLTVLLVAFDENYDLLRTADGREHIIREWCANSSFAFDRRVRVSSQDESFEGITRGLERDGALRIETQTGIVKTIRAGEVTALRPSQETQRPSYGQ